jgi:hypothetical protein
MKIRDDLSHAISEAEISNKSNGSAKSADIFSDDITFELNSAKGFL